MCEDMLAEYGRNHSDSVNEHIEIIAWQPLPEPYEEVGCAEIKREEERKELKKLKLQARNECKKGW